MTETGACPWSLSLFKVTHAILLHARLVRCTVRDVHDPRALATIFAKAEADLDARKHPDPYRRESLFFLRNVYLVLMRGDASTRGSGWYQVVRSHLVMGFDRV